MKSLKHLTLAELFQTLTFALLPFSVSWSDAQAAFGFSAVNDEDTMLEVGGGVHITPYCSFLQRIHILVGTFYIL